MPQLTLIMPVFNAESTLPGAVRSYDILHDALDGDTQLIIVDDCSADSSFPLAKSFCRAATSIEAVQTKINEGPGAARNFALNLIPDRTAGYVGFLDADDQILPDGYSCNFLEGTRQDADIIIHNGIIRKEDGIHQKYDHERLTSSTDILVRKCVRGELDGSVIFSCFKHQHIRKNKSFFRTGYYEDIAFQHLLLVSAKNRFYGTYNGYEKIDRLGSIINSISRLHIDGLLQAFDDVCRGLSVLELDQYSQFIEDASYGMHGAVGRLISDILHFSPLRDQTKLLSYLRETALNRFQLDSLPVRMETKFDRVTEKLFALEAIDDTPFDVELLSRLLD